MITPMTYAQRTLAESNIGLAKQAANDMRQACRAANLPIDEAFAEASFGLCRAAQAFNPNKGFKFSSYGYASSRNQIRRACASNCVVSVPAYLAEKEGFQRPTVDRLDKELNIGPYEGLTHMDILIDASSNMEDRTASQDRVEWLMEGLDERQRDICKLLMSGYNKSQIGRMYGMSKQGIDYHISKIKKIMQRKVDMEKNDD